MKWRFTVQRQARRERILKSENMDSLLAALKAAAEPTRLRLIALLADNELTVTELTQILCQSQPRLSRHLKLLRAAGILDRFREGSWVFYRLSENAPAIRLAHDLLGHLPPGDPAIARDRARLASVRHARTARAAKFFQTNAACWDRIRALHIPEAEIETVFVNAVQGRQLNRLVDLGTGTGRIVEILAPHVGEAVGLDLSAEMLSLARVRLDQAGLANCQLRQASIFDVPVPDNSQDIVTIHQVLHFLDDPPAAIAEAARILAPSGLLLIADFAPHMLDFLRDSHAHRRLGFQEKEVANWCRQSGLEIDKVLDLPPEDVAGKLTVTIWSALKMNGGGRSAAAMSAAHPLDVLDQE